MGVQQLISNDRNVLENATVTASSVALSTEITTTAMSRQGTGLVELNGPYSGHVAADYDIEIVSGDGNGRSSAPAFVGEGSGSLSVTAAAIPAQEVTITLLTPPYAGATAECRIGNDIVRAMELGASGNMISITVNRSGLSFADSGSSALEEIAAGTDELTTYMWDIPGVACSTDLKGNVPADAPRVCFGSDPAIYRIAKDSRSGILKTILTPAAIRAIPLGAPIHLVAGSYAVTVGNGTTTESYGNIITPYNLLVALVSSTLVRPAYTPAPVATPDGNAAIDLPIITSAIALLTNSTSAGVRPPDLLARATAAADTITFQSRGNGAWTVSGACGTTYPDALEGETYAPAESPVLLTIPEKPTTATSSATLPVSITNINLASRETGVSLPTICVEGVLGKNAAPKTITAVYTARPAANDCPCPTDAIRWDRICLGLDTSIIREDIMGLDPAYQSRLISLYTWQRDFIGSNALLEGSGTTGATSESYVQEYTLTSSMYNDPLWEAINNKRWDSDAHAAEYYNSLNPSGPHWQGTVTRAAGDTRNISILLTEAYPTAPQGALAGELLTESATGSTTPMSVLSDAVDINLCKRIVTIFAGCIAQTYLVADACTAWDTAFETMQTSLTAIYAQGGTASIFGGIDALVTRYQAESDRILTIAGVVPGKTDPATGMTGCWQDIEGETHWWVLSDGYAPAFSNATYYSTSAGTLENTHEFGFEIRCGCTGRLLEGDTITIQIAGNMADAVWSSNESLTITTIPASPLYLAGGENADTNEVWSVAAKSSSNAALPAATLTDVIRSYSSGGLAFELAAGGIPFGVGDRFTFAVEGGTFRWCRDSGVWSPAAAITDGAVIDEGLTASFTPGQAPSFIAGDSFSFHAAQPAAAIGLLAPGAAAWSWPTATATLTITLPVAKQINTLSILHSLPAGAAIAVEYSADGTTFAPLAWASGVVRNYLHASSGASVTAKAIRLTVDHPGSIRWVWAGVPFQPEHSAALRIRRMFDVSRSKQAGAAALLGQGEGATIMWDVLTPADADGLIDMVRHIKNNGDQPVILIPQHLHPEEAITVRLAADDIELTDVFEYQPDDVSNRLLSASMELTPEWR